MLGFTKRKTSFAEQVAMSEGLKQRTVRLLDKVLEARQVAQDMGQISGADVASSPSLVRQGRESDRIVFHDCSTD